MDLLKELNEKTGTTIIVVTHDDKMARLTKKILNLKDGRIAKVRDIDKIDTEVRKKMDSVCTSCGEELQTSWKVCPLCETKVGS
jgi:ABC-type glutathione transport system ATPase component